MLLIIIRLVYLCKNAYDGIVILKIKIKITRLVTKNFTKDYIMKKLNLLTLLCGIIGVLTFSNNSYAKTAGERLDNTIDKVSDEYDNAKDSAKDNYEKAKDYSKEKYDNTKNSLKNNYEKTKDYTKEKYNEGLEKIKAK